MSYEQCLAAGMSRRQVEHRLRTGRWRRVHRGVYAVVPGALDELGACHAAALAVGPAGALSHRSAASLWSVRASHAGPRHVTTYKKRPSRADLVVHWTRDLPATDVTTRRGVRSTTLTRTLVDLADELDLAEMERALRTAERLHGLGREHLRPVHGRRGHARTLGGGMVLRGHLEPLFLKVIDEARISRPEMNVPWGPYEIDALWPVPRVAAEIDDWDSHGQRDRFESDRVRDRVLTIAGFTPVRITHFDLTDGRAQLLRHLHELGVR